MSPALTFHPRRPFAARRLIGGVAGVVLTIGAGMTALTSAPDSTQAPTPRSLAQQLAESTWALALPVTWLAAPIPAVEPGDSVDLLAVRIGDRPLAVPIAADLRVMSTDERAITFEVDEDAATAVATARASGLLIVPLLRSER